MRSGELPAMDPAEPDERLLRSDTQQSRAAVPGGHPKTDRREWPETLQFGHELKRRFLFDALRPESWPAFAAGFAEEWAREKGSR
jgi:hypothetical protein